MADYDLLKKLMVESLKDFYRYDKDLFEYSVDPISERCMVFRIALYMHNKIREDATFDSLKLWDLDCEYNRYEYVIKDAEGEKYIIPDLILHKRKENENNILCMEFKKEETHGPDFKNDVQKLMYLTSEKEKYKYCYGFHVILGVKGSTIDVYEKGQKDADKRFKPF